MNQTPKRWLIVGAGSFGRELAAWICDENAVWHGRTFGGFLDDNPAALAAYPECKPGVIASIADYMPGADEILVMGIADPKTKLETAQRLETRGSKFVSYVHGSALVSARVKLGRGVVLCPRVVVSCDANIGDFAAVNLGSTVGHDVKLGRGATLSAHVDLTGFVTVGEGAFFGTHATTLPHAKIGEFAKVGAGSVVLRSAPAGATVMGVPARQLTP